MKCHILKSYQVFDYWKAIEWWEQNKRANFIPTDLPGNFPRVTGINIESGRINSSIIPVEIDRRIPDNSNSTNWTSWILYKQTSNVIFKLTDEKKWIRFNIESDIFGLFYWFCVVSLPKFHVECNDFQFTVFVISKLESKTVL